MGENIVSLIEQHRMYRINIDREGQYTIRQKSIEELIEKEKYLREISENHHRFH